jgi:hypothetical protein
MLPTEFNNMTADERNHLLRDMLKQDCEVTFTKVDGTERVMPCTLRTEVMPQRAVNEHHQTRVYKPETLSVWCLDKAEWRAFKVMNVTSVKLL